MQMKHALDSYVIKGVNHNIPLLRDIIGQPRFVSGDISTKFIQEVYPGGFKGFVLGDHEKHQLLTAAAFFHAISQVQSQTFTNQRNPPSEYFYSGEVVASLADEHVPVTVQVVDKDEHVIAVGDNEPVTVRGHWALGDTLFEATINDEKVVLQYLGRNGSKMALGFCGSVFQVTVQDPFEHQLSQYLPQASEESHVDEVMAPMTGAVVSVMAKPGDLVCIITPSPPTFAKISDLGVRGRSRQTSGLVTGSKPDKAFSSKLLSGHLALLPHPCSGGAFAAARRARGGRCRGHENAEPDFDSTCRHCEGN